MGNFPKFETQGTFKAKKVYTMKGRGQNGVADKESNEGFVESWKQPPLLCETP